jgi:hypothetical protein
MLCLPQQVHTTTQVFQLKHREFLQQGPRRRVIAASALRNELDIRRADTSIAREKRGGTTEISVRLTPPVADRVCQNGAMDYERRDRGDTASEYRVNATCLHPPRITM